MSEEMDEAGREFELLNGSVSDALKQRTTDGFMVRTITPGLSFMGSAPYTAPGTVPSQTGPTPATNMFLLGSNGLGDPGSVQLALFNNILNPLVPNPGSEPAVGPEERLRYSCVAGTCLQDPNGVYYGIDECQADGCGADSGGGGPGKGCDCGYGLTHTVFKATITAADGPYTDVGTGRNWWLYSFTEVGGTRASDAVNEYELSIPNDGANVGPAGVVFTRLQVPTGAVVPMFIDLSGGYWFHFANPLQVSCS